MQETAYASKPGKHTSYLDKVIKEGDFILTPTETLAFSASKRVHKAVIQQIKKLKVTKNVERAALAECVAPNVPAASAAPDAHSDDDFWDLPFESQKRMIDETSSANANLDNTDDFWNQPVEAQLDLMRCWQLDLMQRQKLANFLPASKGCAKTVEDASCGNAFKWTCTEDFWDCPLDVQISYCQKRRLWVSKSADSWDSTRDGEGQKVDSCISTAE